MVTEATACTFSIKEANVAEDSAEYKCSATNTAGSVDCVFSITVQGIVYSMLRCRFYCHQSNVSALIDSCM